MHVFYCSSATSTFRASILQDCVTECQESEIDTDDAEVQCVQCRVCDFFFFSSLWNVDTCMHVILVQ